MALKGGSSCKNPRPAGYVPTPLTCVKASGVIGEGSDSFPIVEEFEAKKSGIPCAVYCKILKLTLYINYFRLCLKNTEQIMFADDKSVFIKGKNIHKLFNKSNNELSRIDQ